MHLPAVYQNGAQIDLSHLKKFKIKALIELPPSITKPVDVEFVFTCHCYSRRLLKDEAAPKGHFIREGVPKNPRNRTFDQTRYDLSKFLKAHLEELVQQNGNVSKTNKHNFFRITDGGTGAKYFIIMNAKKISEPGRPKHMQVVVESAYPDDPSKPSPNAHGGRTFGQMLGEKWM